jgi:hypothetical protein
MSTFADDHPPQDSANSTNDDAVTEDVVTSSQKSLIEDIVVEGERDDTTLKDTAHSVEVFTAEQLTLGTERNMTDLLQRGTQERYAPQSDRQRPVLSIQSLTQAAFLTNPLLVASNARRRSSIASGSLPSRHPRRLHPLAFYETDDT